MPVIISEESTISVFSAKMLVYATVYIQEEKSCLCADAQRQTCFAWQL